MASEGSDRFHVLLSAAAAAAAVGDPVPKGQARFSERENKVLARLVTEYLDEREMTAMDIISSDGWDIISTDFYSETGSNRRDKKQIRKRYSTMKLSPTGKVTLEEAQKVLSWEKSAPEALMLLASGTRVGGSPAEASVQQRKMKGRAA